MAPTEKGTGPHRLIRSHVRRTLFVLTSSTGTISMKPFGSICGHRIAVRRRDRIDVIELATNSVMRSILADHGATFGWASGGTLVVAMDERAMGIDVDAGTVRWIAEKGLSYSLSIHTVFRSNGTDYVVIRNGGESPKPSTVLSALTGELSGRIAASVNGVVGCFADHGKCLHFRRKTAKVELVSGISGDVQWSVGLPVFSSAGRQYAIRPAMAIGTDLAVVGAERFLSVYALSGEARWEYAFAEGARIQGVAARDDAVVVLVDTAWGTQEGPDRYKLQLFAPNGSELGQSTSGPFWRLLEDGSILDGDRRIRVASGGERS